ncbi:hypothetical protein FKM82_017423 [Ascaphus truei]
MNTPSANTVFTHSTEVQPNVTEKLSADGTVDNSDAKYYIPTPPTTQVSLKNASMHPQCHPESAPSGAQPAVDEIFPFVPPQPFVHPSNFHVYTHKPQGWPQSGQSSPHTVGQYVWPPYVQHPPSSFYPSYAHHLQQHVAHPSYDGYIPMSAPPPNLYTPQTH